MTPLFFDFPIKITIFYSTYEKDTLDACSDIRLGLESRGHEVVMVEIKGGKIAQALKIETDVAICLVEDINGNWSVGDRLARKLVEMGTVVVGYNSRVFNYYLDKGKMKTQLEQAGVRTAKYRVIKSGKHLERVVGMEFPMIVKPSGEHASLGISQDSVVIDNDELIERINYIQSEFGGDVLVEEYIEGREFHITVMGNRRHCAVLPYSEINFGREFESSWQVYTHNAKWNEKSWEYWGARLECPVFLKKDIEKVIDKTVIKAYRALDCCDIVRFDVRLDVKNRPYVIDVNVMPSINNDSMTESWRSAQSIGWTYPQFIETLVAIAYKRVHGRLPDKLLGRRILLGG